MKSITDRYNQLDGNIHELERRAQKLSKAPLHPVHVELVKLMSDMFEQSAAMMGGQTPAPLRALFRTMRKLQPTLVEEMAGVDPEAIRVFMIDMIARMEVVARASVREIEGSIVERPALESAPRALPGGHESETA